MGIVLIYRANRIINFAQGDLGAVAGVLSVSLIVGPGWPFLPAVASASSPASRSAASSSSCSSAASPRRPA